MDVNLQTPSHGASRVARSVSSRGWRGLWGMFNLNDPRWGRGDDASRNEGQKDGAEAGRDDERNAQCTAIHRGNGLFKGGLRACEG